MKYNTVFIALLLGTVSSLTIKRSSGEESAAAGQADDLDALMDKYDAQEVKKN